MARSFSPNFTKPLEFDQDCWYWMVDGLVMVPENHWFAASQFLKYQAPRPYWKKVLR